MTRLHYINDVYGGKEGESLVDTRVRMYQQQTKKKTSSLPPDPNSLKHDILRKHHQAYTWKRSIDQYIDPLPLNENGWNEEEGDLIPVWYTCKQLPLSLRQKTRPSTKDTDLMNEITLPVEVDNFIEDEPPNKRSKPSENGTESVTQEKEIEELSDWERLSDFDSSDCDSSDDPDW